MMIIKKVFNFEASHQLLHHDGKCQRLHGHSYSFTLEVGGGLISAGPKQNMVHDYSDIGTEGKRIENLLDHRHLNDIIDQEMPTAELIAGFIFREVAENIPSLWAVSVSETEATSARFCPFESRIFEIGLQEVSRLRQRVYENVKVGDDDECWPWTRACDKDGYGYILSSLAGERKAHRLVMWLEGYEIKGWKVRHTCDNPTCCNPKHLRVGTHQQNEADKDSRGRRPIGADHGMAILDETQVQSIRDSFEVTDLTAAAFAREQGIRYGVSASNITAIITNKTWKNTNSPENQSV